VPTTTRHLRVLEEACLLRQEKHGRTRVYTLDKTLLALVTEPRAGTLCRVPEI